MKIWLLADSARARFSPTAKLNGRPLYSAETSLSALLRQQPRRTFTSATDSSEKVLLSQDDWTAFQLDRAERTTLVDIFSKFGSTQNRDNTWQPHHSLHRPTAPRDLTLSALLAAGAHLGHHSSLLNPNFIPYAYGTRAGITIIDLERTLPHLRRAASLVRGVASRDGTIVPGYHVGEKWLPGTLTNKVHFFGPEVSHAERVIPDLVISSTQYPTSTQSANVQSSTFPLLGS
ncbi:ribosomal protein S2, flavodoxin-like domain-containing protein [Lactarius quietus]|nr:ribosomal protein S2, flavodoxin-like domain-containing protein [Lactarius quietus]